MIDVVSIDLAIMMAIVAMGVMAIRRCVAIFDHRLRDVTDAVRELRENRIEVGIHRPASDPEPLAIVERDEPTEPTDLPRATARTRKP